MRKNPGLISHLCGNVGVLAALLAQELRKAGLPVPRMLWGKNELQFHAGRKWRFDLAMPDLMLAVELDGGVWMRRGGHTTGTGATHDREKDRAAQEDGWHVFRVTTDELTREPGKVADQLVRIIRRKGERNGEAEA